MLSLLGYIYGRIANLRNWLYDRGIFESYDLKARTISIGNITTGGTGKTPLVAYVANILAERGEKVCILTRGYGRKDTSKRVLVSDGEELLATPAESGDEPFELAQKLLGKAIVIADADRVAAADWAVREFGVITFVLDDGFQHRRAKRDVDIACIDATNPFGGGKILPAGRLRESVENLKRASAIVITRADQVDDISGLRSEISKVRSDIPVFSAKSAIVSIHKLGEFLASKSTEGTDESAKTKRAFAFCGLGNPDNFYSLLRTNEFDIAETRSFRDHHKYSQGDIRELERSASVSGTTILITTVKDAVKLSDLKFQMPVYVVEIDVEIDDAEVFAQML